jgi:hypothetical protein
VGYPTLRRLYLANRRSALSLGDAGIGAVGFWRWKQEQIAWPDLPATFPSRAKLIAEGYQTVRDLDGADVDELREIGLTRQQALAVLAAMQEWPPMITKVLKGYQEQGGLFAGAFDAPLVPSAARTASGTGETLEVGDEHTLRLTLDVTAASGTLPTLDVIVETSADGATGWRSVYAFGQKTTTGSDRQSFSNLDRFVRCSWVIGGTTPSFTWSLTGELV